MTSAGITAQTMLSTLPDVLLQDANLYALAQVVAEACANQIEPMASVGIYHSIDALPESLLDILAYDFKVDWWDGNYSLSEKRQTLQDSWNVHRTMGTKYAVERAIAAVFQQATVEEWFTYGGEPYHFRLCIDMTEQVELSQEMRQRAIDRVAFYKNLRSVMESIVWTITMPSMSVHVGATLGRGYMSTTLPITQSPSTFAFAVYPAATLGKGHMSTTIPATPSPCALVGVARISAAAQTILQTTLPQTEVNL